jgi:hypothetical protein
MFSKQIGWKSVDWINLVHFSSLQLTQYRDKKSCYLTTSTEKNLLTYVLASEYSSLCDETSRTYKSVLVLLNGQNLSVITISVGSLYFKFFSHNFRVAWQILCLFMIYITNITCLVDHILFYTTLFSVDVSVL